MHSIKKVIVTSLLLVLLGAFLFIPKSAFSFCLPGNAVKNSADAVTRAVDLTRDNNWANFSELGGTHNFVALLNTESNCCLAGGGGYFSWEYLNWVWGIDLKVRSKAPGFLVSILIDRCGRPVWHGKMVDAPRPL